MFFLDFVVSLFSVYSSSAGDFCVFSIYDINDKNIKGIFKKTFYCKPVLKCTAVYLDLLLCFNRALPDYYINASVY